MDPNRVYKWAVAVSTISPGMTAEDLQKAEFLLGPWLVGAFVDILLQGILFCQFAHYFEVYRDDRLRLKLTVAGLVIITTLKSIQSFAVVWIQNILYFNDLGGAILLAYTAWWQSGNALMVSCTGLYVQVFFLYRLYWISTRRWWVIVPIAVLLAFAFCAICVATYYITLGVAYGYYIGLWFAAHLSTVFVGDLSITLSITFFLIKSRKDVLPQTVGIIDSLIRLTFSTAAPAALCAMFNLIFSQIYKGENSLISVAFNQALPKLYAFSMMWTLNARRSVRASAYKYTSEDWRPRVGNSVELSGYSDTQLHTEISTRHADIRNMFHHQTVKSIPEDQSADRSSRDPMYKELA
ncbi:hypothetical protein AX15_000942 [Amanita polypyramis BW_CC]|nr:hypothetical protein AX15_000942 [Amanita polypyramis BW_CC]